MPDPRLTVLYDDDCGFCKWCLNRLLAWDRRKRLRPVAIQAEEGQALLRDVPPAERLDSWHLVLPSGEVFSAGAGAAPLADQLPFGRPLAWLFRRFPGTTERAYRWVARNRSLLARLVRVDASCEVRR
ncbi:MAG TPA: DCC1-like thiol-disulfide oxidoreductase family protein [Solirubrobacterales bacterium]|nr:DCC1-like thiol-disulfide oxidoreductase family protein [Solirubrobacterales bacterium]